MKFFYLSSKTNPKGQYEVHEKECRLIPDAHHRDYLGPYNNGGEALRKARLLKSNVVCCGNCCKTAFHAVFGSCKVDKS